MDKVEHSSRRVGDLTIFAPEPASDDAVYKAKGGNVF